MTHLWEKLPFYKMLKYQLHRYIFKIKMIKWNIKQTSRSLHYELIISCSSLVRNKNWIEYLLMCSHVFSCVEYFLMYSRVFLYVLMYSRTFSCVHECSHVFSCVHMCSHVFTYILICWISSHVFHGLSYVSKKWLTSYVIKNVHKASI